VQPTASRKRTKSEEKEFSNIFSSPSSFNAICPNYIKLSFLNGKKIESRNTRGNKENTYFFTKIRHAYDDDDQKAVQFIKILFITTQHQDTQYS